MATLGNDILVLADNKVICGTKANTVQSGAETIEIASESGQDWFHCIAGRKQWSVTVSFLLVPASTGNMSVSVGNLLSVGSSYTLIIKKRNGSGVKGSAILKTMEVSGVRGNLATGSWKFEGNGALENV